MSQLNTQCEAVKGTICATRGLRANLADSMDMVAEFLGKLSSLNNPTQRNASSTSRNNQGNCNVSATQTSQQSGRSGRGGCDGHGRGGDGNAQMLRDDKISVSRYYSNYEWWNRMTKEQCTRLHNMRQNNQANNSSGTANRNNSAMETEGWQRSPMSRQ